MGYFDKLHLYQESEAHSWLRFLGINGLFYIGFDQKFTIQRIYPGEPGARVSRGVILVDALMHIARAVVCMSHHIKNGAQIFLRLDGEPLHDDAHRPDEVRLGVRAAQPD